MKHSPLVFEILQRKNCCFESSSIRLRVLNDFSIQNKNLNLAIAPSLQASSDRRIPSSLGQTKRGSNTRFWESSLCHLSDTFCATETE